MWQAISYVSSGITLVAFIVAAAAWLYKSQSESKERLIKEAAEDHRAELVRDALEVFRVETSGLTKDQQYKIALEQIRACALRFRTVSIVVCFLALIAGGVSIYAIAYPPTSIILLRHISLVKDLHKTVYDMLNQSPIVVFDVVPEAV
jgi:hypothetical protein